MKSYELTVIRTEGIQDCSYCELFFNSKQFGKVNFLAHPQSTQFFLPLKGLLGLKIHSENSILGEVFIDVDKFESDGLQWLPILKPDYGLIECLPDDVPMPRILVSFFISKNQHPDLIFQDSRKLTQDSQIDQAKTIKKKLKNQEKIDENRKNPIIKKYFDVDFNKNHCEKCKILKAENKIFNERILKLTQKVSVLGEKLTTQEFYNQELMITNQDYFSEIKKLKDVLNKPKSEENQDRLKVLNEVLNNNQIFDELDEKIDKSYPELLKNSLKLMRGVYIYNKKKILVQEKGNHLVILLDSKEVNFASIAETDLPKHEKKSFSLEDISNHLSLRKKSNLIHNRATSRESKLRILSKQW